MATIVGVDPGARTGLAMIQDGTLTKCTTVSWGTDGRAVRETIEKWWLDGNSVTLVVIEEPGASIFPRAGVSAGGMLKIARSVGQLEEKVKNLAGYLRDKGLTVTLAKPVRGATKRKMTPDVWQQIVRWHGRRMPSSHARDASMLAWHYSKGRS